MQKLYCYIDESGQDSLSEFFIVVAIINEKEQQALRDALLNVELFARTGILKWHKSRHERRMQYLRTVVQKHIGAGGVYFGRYKKPLPYFFPVLETIKRAILKKASASYRVIVFCDGIDRKKAAELTNALRLDGIRLEMIRSRRDESEPLIRLADMWAGCIRDALLKEGETRTLFHEAMQAGYLVDITK